MTPHLMAPIRTNAQDVWSSPTPPTVYKHAASTRRGRSRSTS